MKLWNIWSSRVYVSNENNMGLFSLVFLPSPTVLVEKFGVSLFVGLVLYSESNHHNDLWCVFKAKDGTYGMPKIGILRHFLLWKKKVLPKYGHFVPLHMCRYGYMYLTSHTNKLGFVRVVRYETPRSLVNHARSLQVPRLSPEVPSASGRKLLRACCNFSPGRQQTSPGRD